MDLRLPVPTSVLGHVAVLWGLLVLVNIPAPWLGLTFEPSARRVSLEPPGWVIPTIWFGLFALLGVARWRLAQDGGADAAVAVRGIEALALLCATYAYYTLGLARLTGVSALVFGGIGNLVTMGAALLVAALCARAVWTTGWLVLPIVAWVAYATALVAQQWRAGLR